MEISPEHILLASLVISVIVIYYWYQLGVNVKEIKNRINRNDFSYCIEEAKIAEFSGKKDDALNWYYRALYFEIYKNTDDSNRTNRIENLKNEYGESIAKLGGNWPQS